MNDPTPLVAYTRAHLIAGRRGPTPGGPGQSVWRLPWPDPSTLPWPHLAVVFDCETTTDRAKRLLFGCCRVLDGESVIGEGLFYGNDLAPGDIRRIERYAKDHALDVCSARAFVKNVLTFWGFRKHHRVTTDDGEVIDHMRGAVVGFNLPFDLGALAVDWIATEKERSFWGGWTLTLADYARADGSRAADVYTPRLYAKKLHAGTLFRWGWPQNSKPGIADLDDGIPEGAGNNSSVPGYHYRGRFLDLQTLGEALTGENLSLEGLCKHFGVDYQKPRHTFDRVSDELIDYCRADVAATAALYRAELAEWERHGLGSRPDRVLSSAGLAKRYLAAMGLRQAPPLVADAHGG
jgi:hypothetical protein